ncbi:phospholipase D-like domain-containing protein [Roseitranquillus sediminis]|uniref:phospholipase D-like domain-containing protein n=1 Tax=Roseitranquillus sediminis TaxID=2809051 RepID=UPI001D0C6B4D|nr:phospholipase D-like domain-containing protein [Roseitranquillus sediminis]MBM9593494.1 phospholipase [Roseitranquillus sediminis]
MASLEAKRKQIGEEWLSYRLCITAEEAFPEYERHFLSAREEIVASFRIFDPSTRLRSPEGRAIGETWRDLIEHVLRSGVEITLYITDFDAIAASSLHQCTWRSIRELSAVAELAGPDAARLRLVAAAHPARVGLLPTLVLYPRLVRELQRRARELARLSPELLRTALRDMPCLAPYIRQTDKGPRPAYGFPRLIPASHHQKVAVFDRKRITLGGLDLNERRWDTKEHRQPADETWHDVQIFLDDPGRARAAVEHILSLQRVTGGMMAPPRTPGLLRTLSRRRRTGFFLSPHRLVREISMAHRRRIATSRKLIYIETQFLRDLRTAQRLARAARKNPDLNLILIIPAAPDDLAFNKLRRADVRLGEFLQARCLRMLRSAYGSRVFIGAPVQPRRYFSEGRDALWGGPIIYVHSKVSVFDDDAAIVSSANLNGRSLYWDTELGLELTRPADVRHLRRRCFEHWLPEGSGPEFYDAETALESWRRLAVDNLYKPPEERRGFVLPYDPTPADRFGRDLPAVPDEIV